VSLPATVGPRLHARKVLEEQTIMTDRDMARGRTPKTTDRDILDACTNCEHLVFGSGDIAEMVAIGRQRVRERMAELADNGVLRCREVGSTKVYWVDCQR